MEIDSRQIKNYIDFGKPKAAVISKGNSSTGGDVLADDGKTSTKGIGLSTRLLDE
jgi:hypothetical protein